MADDLNNQPDKQPDASGAGTTTHKVKKADAAKLPGGADFDVAAASSEDFNKHYEILARRAKLAALTPAAAPVPVTLVDTAPAVAAAPDPSDIRAVNAQGEVRYFTTITWDALGEQRGGWQEQVAKPTDI